MNQNPYQPSDVLTARPNTTAPMSAYLYSVATFLTAFCLVTSTLWFVPVRLLTFLELNRFSFLAIGFLSGLLLGTITGVRTWRRCIRAHASRVEFEMKREQLLEDYGRGPGKT